MYGQFVVRDLGGDKVLHKGSLSDIDLCDLIHEGLPFASLEYVIKNKILTKEEALRFIVVQRTFDRRKKSKRLSEVESDKLVRILRVRNFAGTVLGAEDADEWLRIPNPILNDKVPLDLLETDIGAQLVEATLGRIAHGIVS